MIRKAWLASLLAAVAVLPACGGEGDTSTSGTHSGPGGSGGAGGAAVCGDGKVTGGETCDDGNATSGDGCDESCATEDGYACDGTPSVCAIVCGDGKLLGAEVCDDGNAASGDGCDAQCIPEAGFTCTGAPSSCVEICGDAVMVGKESCDDANTTAGDGCDDTCQEELGYTCNGEPSVCTIVCGDGVKAGAEACDDGDTDAGDGCDDLCEPEFGYDCAGTMPSVCTAICGDFFVAAGEECEDGNTLAGDGCSPTCKFEGTCGNGNVEPGETCDDGNVAANDGCDATCHLEVGTVCGDAVDIKALGMKSGNVTTYDGDTTPSTNTAYGDPTCSTGTLGIKRVVHKYVVGPHSAVLTAEMLPVPGSGLTDTTLWAYLDCQDTSVELACDEDSGPGLFSFMTTPVLPAGSAVFIVVSGFNVGKVGPYKIKVTETHAQVISASGTCAAAVDIGPGTYGGQTLANDINNATGSCTGDLGPDAVFSFTLTKPADVTATATSLDDNYDIGIYMTNAPCGAGIEVLGACADVPFAVETIHAKNLPAGTYYLFVDGFGSSDHGPYTLTLDIVDIIPMGEICVPGDPLQICAPGTYCVGTPGTETCQAPAATLAGSNFSGGLSPFVTVDFGNDGQTWAKCNPNMGCFTQNLTNSGSGGSFALVLDANNVNMNGEILSTPALDATGLTTVLLDFHHFFDHFQTSTDLGAVELSTDNVNWSPIASYTTTTSGRQLFDISAQAAGQAAFYVRFRYDDQTNGGNPWANGWSLDDVYVIGF